MLYNYITLFGESNPAGHNLKLGLSRFNTEHSCAIRVAILGRLSEWRTARRDRLQEGGARGSGSSVAKVV